MDSKTRYFGLARRAENDPDRKEAARKPGEAIGAPNRKGRTSGYNLELGEGLASDGEGDRERIVDGSRSEVKERRERRDKECMLALVEAHVALSIGCRDLG